MSFPASGLYRFDDFELSPARRTFARNGTSVAVSPKAFENLTYLVTNPGRVVTKDELLKAVWPESFVEESNLSQHIFALRRALGDKAGCIATITGRGYQFTAEVHATPQPEAALVTGEPGADYIVQHIRERTQVVIQETSQATAAIPERASFFRSIPGRWIAWGVMAMVVAAASGAYLWKHFAKPPELRKVLIGEFLNLTGDPSLDHYLTSGLEIGLGQSPYIQLMGAGEEQGTLTTMGKATDTPLLGDTALEVCRRSNYQALLRGKIESSFEKFGYRLSLDVVNCASGKTLATYHADALNKDALLNTLDGLAERVRRKLGESSQSIEQFGVPLENDTTFSFEALEDYNKGSKLGNEGKLRECIPYFQKAVDIDPKYAMAQASLGTAYFDLGDVVKAGEYSRKAFDLSANISQIEKFFIRHNYYQFTLRDLNAGEKNAQEWTQVYPGDPTGWEALADLETQLGNFPAAIQAGEQSLRFVQWRSQMPFELLSRAYQRANRFADAKRIIAEAQEEDKAGPHLHHILLVIAIAEQDRQAIQHEIEWNKGKPEEYVSLEYQAILAADQGKARQSEELFSKAIPAAAKEVNADLADSLLLDEARIEVQLGRTARATELLRQVRDTSSPDYATLVAGAGNYSAAEVFLKKPEQYPQGTIEHNVLLPEVKALLALHHHDPAGAIAALEPSRPYELARAEALELRAQAYLAAGLGEKAETDFKELIANPALEDPTMPRTILAHLGLARAYALEKKTARSRDEYEKLFALWAEADGDLAILQQARSEFAHLQ
jgi:DNA-binding winged helix-turn-helix (wHTH) protein/tetratricopeptide (TPR) repeat protein